MVMKNKDGTWSRRDMLRLAVAGAAAGMAAMGAGAAEGEKKRKPNFVLILADDLGYGDLGCYGSTLSSTPNLDRLAAGGVRFTDFHSNGAVCSPTRAALLTGRYQQRAGIESVLRPTNKSDKAGLPAEEVTFATLLRDAGYQTGIMGKWHLGYAPAFNPLQHGFDVFHGFLSGNVDYHSHVNGAGELDWWNGLQIAKEEGYTTDLITDHGIRFIEQNKDRAFCLYLAYNAVHDPYQGPNDPAIRAPGKPVPREGLRKDRKRAYREMTESMDDAVGRIISTLEQLGLDRDTFVFFCSDNGAVPFVGSNAPLSGHKGGLKEGGHRVPAIGYWPGRIAPATSAQTAMTMDVFPTLAEAAGVSVPPGLNLDGSSMLPLLTEGKPMPDRNLFWRTGANRPERAVRSGAWKLRLTPEETELYNLDADLAETRNLASEMPDKVQDLKAALAEWERQF